MLPREPGSDRIAARRASPARIVISYRRDDAAALVYRIAERLKDRFGPSSIFIDVHSIRAGDDWDETLRASIAGSDVLLVMIGHSWSSEEDVEQGRGLADDEDVVRREIQTALDEKIVIVPVLLDGAPFPRAGALPMPIRRLASFHAYSLHSDRFEYETEGLADSVDAQVDLTAAWARRILAFGIDALLPASMLFGIEAPIPQKLVMTIGAYVLYHWLLVGATGGTVGKLLAGTSVVFLDSGGQRWLNAVLRPTLGYLASMNPLGFAQLMLHPKGSTLHDRLFRTRVLRASAKAGGPLRRRLDALSQAIDELEHKILGRLGRVGRWMAVAVLNYFGVGPLIDRLRGRAMSEEDADVDVDEGNATSVLAATLPAVIVGALLALLSLTTYEAIAPQSARIFDRGSTVVVVPDQPPVIGTSVLVLADNSGSMSGFISARNAMIQALREGGLAVTKVGVNTGGVDGELIQALKSNHQAGMDAVYFFSDFADDDPKLAVLRHFVLDNGLRLYAGTVQEDPGLKIRAVVDETGGAVIKQSTP